MHKQGKFLHEHFETDERQLRCLSAYLMDVETNLPDGCRDKKFWTANRKPTEDATEAYS